MQRKQPAARFLAVLELLQTHGRLSGSELAARLGVDRRTVRRYVAALEEMGIPVTTERGPAGGYELVAGYKLPPLMFTPGEALAISLGLAAARAFELTEAAEVESARAKLERVMPESVKGRMRAVGESVAFAKAARPRAATGAALSLLSGCAHARRGVRLRYRDARERSSERDFDPYGLAFSGGNWYAAGYCHLRGGMRTFRLDRVESVAAQERAFARPEGFDTLAHLGSSLATLPRRFSIEVELATDLDSARREVFAALGVLEAEAGGVRMYSQADDLEWFAREMARLPWPFVVRAPRELREAVRRHARALEAAAR